MTVMQEAAVVAAVSPSSFPQSSRWAGWKSPVYWPRPLDVGLFDGPS